MHYLDANASEPLRPEARDAVLMALELEAGEAVPEAVVSAEAEGHVLVRVAGDVEAERLLEHLLVAIA